jgi:arsenate reductase (thioredoxin)
VAAGVSGVAAPMGGKTRILFICTANAARSQMAEGYLRAKYGDRYEVFSAGIRPAGRVTPRAIAVMAEIGIDISAHRPKPLSLFSGVPLDLAVTLCDNVHEACPVVPSAKKTIHHGFPDPHLTPGTDAGILDGYRNVRDAICAWIDATFACGNPMGAG